MNHLTYLLPFVFFICSTMSYAQPVVNIGPDTTVCGTYTLDAGNAGATYLWSTGETTQTITLNITTLISVTVTDLNGSSIDSASITLNPSPELAFSINDTSFCFGPALLSVNSNFGNVVWTDIVGDYLNVGDTLIFQVQGNDTLLVQASTRTPVLTDVGLTSYSNGNFYNSGQNGRGIIFDVLQNLVLEHVHVNVDNGPFTATIDLLDNSQTVIATKNIVLPSAGIHKVELGFDILIGTDYTLRMTSINGGNIYCGFPFSGWTSLTYPFLNMKTGVASTVYSFFYDWGVALSAGGNCSSDFDTVAINALASPIFDLGVDTIICGDSLVLNPMVQGGILTYFWNDSSTDTTLTVYSNGTYHVNITESGLCSVSDTIQLGLDPQPFITKQVNDTTLCQGLINLTSASNTGNIIWSNLNGDAFYIGDTLAYNLAGDDTLLYKASLKLPVLSDVGQTTFDNGAFYNSGQNGRGIIFDVFQDLIIDHIYINVDNGPFSATIELVDASLNVLEVTTVNVPSAGIHKIELGYSVNTGSNYSLLMDGINGGNIYCIFPFSDWATLTYPFMDLKTGVASTVYSFFFDWGVTLIPNGICESNFDTVYITSLLSPEIWLGPDTIVCGDSLLINPTVNGNLLTYQWSTSSFDSSITVYSSGEYVLSATESGICTKSDTITVDIYTQPLILLPLKDTVACEGAIQFVTQTNFGNILWNSLSGDLLDVGDTLDYLLNSNDTILYQASSNIPILTTVGLNDYTSGSFYNSGQNGRGIVFDVLQDMVLDYVYIQVDDGPFTSIIELLDSNQNILSTINVAVPSAGIYKINLGFFLNVGNDYTLKMDAISGGKIYCDFPFTSWSSLSYPYIDLKTGVVSNVYSFFYDWGITLTPSGNCQSIVDSIFITALVSPTVELGSDTLVCGDSLLLNVPNLTGGYTYLWSDATSQTNLLVTNNGLYSITVTDSICTTIDQILVDFDYKPSVTFFPQDSSYCKGIVNVLSASDTGTVFWQNAQGDLIGVGDILNVQIDTPTSLLYYASSLVPSNTSVGLTDFSNGSFFDAGQNGRGIVFDVFEPIYLENVKVFTDDSLFTASIELVDFAGLIVETTTINLTEPGINKIYLGYEIPPGVDYTLRLTDINGANIYCNFPYSSWSNLTYPFLDMKTGVASTVYSFFYDWSVWLAPDGYCSSNLYTLNLDTLSTPNYTLPLDTIVCADSVTLDVSAAYAQTYQWSNGLNNTTITLGNDGQYKVTASIASCSIVDSVDVYLNPSPTISVLSADTLTCAGVIPRIASGNADSYSWYDQPVGGNVIGLGSNLQYNATTLDTIWLQGDNFSNKPYKIGRSSEDIDNSFSVLLSQTQGVIFDVHEYLLLNSVKVFTDRPLALLDIQLWDANDRPIDSLNNIFLIDAGENLINLNFVIPQGEDYKLVINNFNAVGVLYEASNSIYPVSGPYVTIKEGIPSANRYYYFYDWEINLLSCPTPRIPSVIDVLPTPIINFPNDTILCGDSLVLDMSGLNANTYNWSNGQTVPQVTLDSSQMISLLATLGICSDEDSMDVLIVQPPTVITPPADTTICAGVDVTFYVSGDAPFYAWYGSEFSTIPLSVSDSFTNNYSDTTTLYVEGVGFLPESNFVGLDKGYFPNLERWIEPQNTSFSVRRMNFVVNEPIILNTVSMFIQDTVSALVTILRYGYPIYNQTINLTNIGENVIVIDTILETGDYSMQLSNVQGGPILYLSTFNDFNSYNIPEIALTGGFPNANSYNYFFKWQVSTTSCATSRQSFNVNVAKLPFIQLPADTASCTASSIVLDPLYSLNTTGVSYTWSTGATSDTLSVSNSGYYSVTISNAAQCSNSFTSLVQLLQTPTQTSFVDTTFCAPDTFLIGQSLSDGIVVWYEDALQSVTKNITAPLATYISNTTDLYYILAPRSQTRLGMQSSLNAANPNSYSSTAVGASFDVFEFTVLDSVAVYIDQAPQNVSLYLLNAIGDTLESYQAVVDKAYEKVFIPIDKVIEPGLDYELVLSAGNFNILNYRNDQLVSSSSAGIAQINTNIFDYHQFFDWHFSYAYPQCQTNLDTIQVDVAIPVEFEDVIVTCDSAVLTANDPSINTFLWSDGSTNDTLVVFESGFYSVTITDFGNCQLTDSIEVITPSPIFDDTLSTSCDYNLYTNYVDDNAGYIWSTGDTNAIITVTGVGQYNVTVSTSDGCMITDSVYISQIYPAPQPNLPSSINACYADTLDAGYFGPNATYLWNTGDTSQTLIVDQPVTAFYQVTVSFSPYCYGSDFATVTIDTLHNAAFNFTISGQSQVAFDANISTGINNPIFNWYFGDGDSITGSQSQSSPFHSYDSLGCYDVVFIIDDVCGSDTFFYPNILGVPDSICDTTSNNNDTTGLYLIDGDLMSYTIIPNPARDQFQIDFKAQSDWVSFYIVDLKGRPVRAFPYVESVNETLNVSCGDIPQGVYVIQMIDGNNILTKRLVVIRS